MKVRLWKSLGMLSAVAFSMLLGCSVPNISSKNLNGRELLDIPVNLGPQARSLQLSDSQTKFFGLATVATNVYLSVSGCSSGYSLPSTLVSNAFVRLFKGDESCIVKLEQFNFGAVTYAATGTNSVAFSNHLSGDVATFQNTSDENDVIKLFVNNQVTQGGVDALDTVSYAFTDRDSGTEDNIEEANVIVSAGLTVGGAEVPTFSVTESRFLSMNANGTANMSFTLECDAALTGSTNPTYACDSALLQSDLDYILTQDTYSGSLTVDDANDAFAAGSPTTIGSLIVAPAGSDLDGNTLTNGGFYTSNASPLATTGGSIQPSNLDHILLIRRQNTSNETTGYLYFQIRISDLYNGGVSGCGVTFAGGSGTSGDPFLIANRTHLENTANCTSSTYYFKLVENISLGGSSTPWTPIQLYGHIDGNDKTISGLYVNDTVSTDYAGMFTILNNNSSISDLTLASDSQVIGRAFKLGFLAAQIGSSVTLTNLDLGGTLQTVPSVSMTGGTYYIGTVAGYATSSASATNVHSTVDFTFDATTTTAGAHLRFGGLIGRRGGGNISNSSYVGTANFANEGNNNVAVGGIVGESAGTITESWVDWNLDILNTSGNGQEQNYGGIIGYSTATNTNVSRCFVTGSMEFTMSSGHWWNIGGIFGGGVGGAGITDSYSMVSITPLASSGKLRIGGIASRGVSTITRTYAANPSVTGSLAKGFVSTSPTVTDSYLYENGSVPAQTITGLTSYTTVNEMETQGNFNFDFTTPIWRMPSANPLSPSGLLSPVLDWQCGSNGIVCN